MAAIKVLPPNWRILVIILEIGFLFVPDSDAAKAWSTISATVPNADELTIKCPADFHIVITYGEYGNRNHNCSDVFNQHRIAAKCNYKNTCHFPQVSDGMETTCPPNVKKYLSLQYVCMFGRDKLQFYHLTREDDMLHEIICPVNSQILISEARFFNHIKGCTLNAKDELQMSCLEDECSIYKPFDVVPNFNCSEPAQQLLVMYVCKVEEVVLTYVYEGRRGFIECPDEYVIDIISAEYFDPIHDCKPNKVDAHIKKRCSTQQTCHIEHTTFFQFPSGCGTQQTRLVIAFRCIQLTVTRNFTVFENGLVDLSCFTPQKIKIIYASFGKQKKKCGSQTVMEKLMKQCNGKTRCCETANADRLGDSSCPENEMQQLKVTYDCIEDEDVFSIGKSDECEKIRFKIASSFGELTSDTYSKMDQNLLLMIGTSLPRLKQMSMESYNGIIQYMKDIPSLEVVPGSSEERNDSYTSQAEGLTDMISRTKSKYEAMEWYNNFIDNMDIIRDAHVDIRYLAEVMTETGVAVKNVVSLLAANVKKVVENVDIAILRFPDVENPYFLVYNVHIMAWRMSDRLLFYEKTKGGLIGVFRSLRFRPNDEYLKSLKPDLLDSAIEEAEKLFDF